VPEIAFAGGFQEEEAFKDSSAGAFPTGLFGYRYINPLTAPSGTKYSKGNSDDMLDAIAAGEVILAPFPAAAGKTPGCNIDAPALFIPVGAKNADAAYDLINWLLSPAQNPAYVLGPGAGFPVLKSALAEPAYQAPFYQQAAAAVKASVCRPHYGSLEDPIAANEAVMDVVYRVVKEDPTLDIAAELQKAQDQFNSQLP
jgi:multiple sugar transport system substrate-binding protein